MLVLGCSSWSSSFPVLLRSNNIWLGIGNRLAIPTLDSISSKWSMKKQLYPDYFLLASCLETKHHFRAGFGGGRCQESPTRNDSTLHLILKHPCRVQGWKMVGAVIWSIAFSYVGWTTAQIVLKPCKWLEQMTNSLKVWMTATCGSNLLFVIVSNEIDKDKGVYLVLCSTPLMLNLN